MKILTSLLVGLVVNAAALWIAVEIVPNAVFDGRFVDLLLVAFIFGVVNTFVRPIARILTLPLAVITLGLFTLVVNGAMLLLTAAVSDTLDFDGGFFERLWAAILAALIVSIVSVVVGVVVGKILPDDES